MVSRDPGPDSTALARAARLYEAVLTTTPDLAYVFDLQHRFIYANEGLLRMWGRTREDALGKTCLELGYEPWHAAMHDREIDQVVATKQPIRGQVPFSGAFGTRIYDYIFTPVIGKDGEVEAVAGTTRDVTDLRNTEDALRFRTQQYQTLLNQAPLGVYLVDADLVIRELNPIASSAFGDLPGGVVDRSLREVLSMLWGPAYGEQISDIFRKTLETGEPYIAPELAEHRLDRGLTEYYEWRLNRINLPDGSHGIVCYFRDISSQVMARKDVEASRDAIRASEERYKTLFSSIDEGFCVIEIAFDDAGKGRDYRFIEVNPSFERLTGIENAVGRWMREIIPDHEEYWYEVYGEVAATGQSKRFQNQAAQLHRWYDLYAFRVGQPDQRRVAVLFNDITERKQYEETQRLLVNELNHRAKNMLASVQAIVQNTLRRTKDPESFVTSFSGRIQALARVHSLLSAMTWRGADLRDLIRDQLLTGSIEEERLSVWGPSVQLKAQMALHVALVLHELGTNCIKYGALSTPNGRVAVTWTVQNRILRLRWTERGGPPVSAPAARGFGMTLIEQSARGEGGEAHMSIEADGIVWDITLPLPAASPERPWPEISAASRTPSELPDAAISPGKSAPPLSGRKILVVEDEPLVALDIVTALEDAGAEVTGPIGTVKDALEAIRTSKLDAALLDGNLRGEPVHEIASALTRSNVPFAFVTGYDRESLPRGFGAAPVLTKPFSSRQLVEAASRLVEPSADIRRIRDK